MIISKEKKNNIDVFHVKKILTDERMEKLKDTFVKQSQISLIINDDADIYTEDGKLLLIFRKNKLSAHNIDLFYDNVIDFAMNTSTNRGSASGGKQRNVKDNPKVMTNILGYFDKLSPKQKWLLKKQHKTLETSVRQTRFMMDYPENFKQVCPLIQEIDQLYKKYIPDKYNLQRKKADQTPFKIPNTSFTTVTTNVNFRTTMHTDKGDDIDGFGNLAVIEDGDYTGGETCFPQYGIGVNVRTGDILLMDVHQIHGNLPIQFKTPDAIRLSIVCYLRQKIWENTKHKTKKFMLRHNKTMKTLRASNKEK